MGRKRAPLVALCTGLIIALTGCGTVAGTAVPDPSVEARFKLDTGNYPTTPRVIEAGNAYDAWQQEGWRIATAVTAPWSVLPSLKDVCHGEGDDPAPAFSVPMLARSTNGLTSDQKNAIGGSGFQTGFLACGTDGVQTRLRGGILRFTDEASAKRAVSAVAALNPSAAPALPGDFPVKDATIVMYGANPAKGLLALTAMVARGNLVVMSGMSAPTSAAPTMLDPVGKFMAAQVAKLGEYQQTPFDPTKTAYPMVPMDDGGILGLTTPATEGRGATGLSANNAPLNGWGTGHAYELRTAEAVAGLERFAVSELNWVFRFTDEQAAARTLESWKGDKSEPITGLSAQFSGCTAATKQTLCLVRVGRYLGQAASTTPAIAKQQAAAMYVRLRSAK
ncbi:MULTISPECIES: DUF7373 family lipoprotein [unclassified Gordonia (in: high G+C Gram-positive bacteria)]|uniref:DUF7373 family lipoprotein n=1 Tax=unclassified Gordonia (in: high G+C Gram-positive bacteria) TaxID=2657482 RepID=UPI0025BE2FD7|nr:hypothetical protein [Gordonia sp. UBA7599]